MTRKAEGFIGPDAHFAHNDLARIEAVLAEARAPVSVRGVYRGKDGLVYAGNRFRVERPGRWLLRLGGDAPVRVFVDGSCVLTEARRLETVPLERAAASAGTEGRP